MDIGSWIQDNLGGDARGDHDEIIVDCISCGKDNHLYINAKNGLAYCFVCGYSANLVRLMMDLKGVSKKEATQEVRTLLQTNTKRHRTGDDLYKSLYGLLRLSSTRPSTEHFEIKLPERSISINSHYAKKAKHYLRMRGFSEIHWTRYGLRYLPENWTESKFSNHIIFPNYCLKTGDLNYFTTRRVDIGRRKKRSSYNEKSKSYHVSGVSRTKSGVVFGAHTVAKTSNLIYVVEGPFDMMALSGRAIALLGKHMHTAVENFLEHNASTVVIALDGDAEEAGMKLASTLLKNTSIPKIRVAHLKDNDPADRVSAKLPKTMREIYSTSTLFDIRAQLDYIAMYKCQ